jgi:predicted GIY-YIG superfamily endonuclease
VVAQRAATSVVPKVGLYTTTGGERAHLLDYVEAEWRQRDKPFYQAWAVCGTMPRSAVLCAELPDDRLLCEERIWPDERPTVYEVFDKNDELIYVGFSNRLLARLDQHRRTSLWWQEAARVTWTDYESTVDAMVAELTIAREHHPRWNSPSGRRPGLRVHPAKRHLYADIVARIA